MKIKRAHIIEIAIWLVFVLTFFAFSFCAHYFFFIRQNTYTLDFNDVDGAIKGTPVKFMGIIVGHVRKLELKNDRVITKIVITKKGVKIPDGSRAKVEFTGIVGSKSIEILPPENDADGSGIITKDPIKIREFLDSFDTYNRNIVMLQSSLDKLTKGAVSVVEELPDIKNSESIDKKLDEFIDIGKNSGKKTKKINTHFERFNAFIDNINK